MSESPDANLLSQCRLEIELAWNDAKDDATVHRLAKAHPQLAVELYDFFACVIEAEEALDRPRPDFAETDRNVRETLRQATAGKVEEEPRPFLALVREASGESVDAIAVSMDVPLDFLVVVSKHGNVLPRAAREELVRRARRTRTINEGEALASFDAPSHLRRAASRKAAYAPATITYRDMIEHSSLSDEEKRFWSALG